AVALVNIRSRQPPEIDSFPKEFVFLAGAGGDPSGCNRSLFVRPGQRVHQFPAGSRRRKAKRQGDPGQFQAALATNTSGRPEYPESWLNTFDLLEEGSRRPQLIGAPDDRAHLEMPIDLGLDFLQLADGFQSANVVPETAETVHDRGAGLVKWLLEGYCFFGS